jgi:hypothetical protein
MYQYEPLGSAGNKIRLTVVQPGAFDEPIHIKFMSREFKICKPSVIKSCPRYGMPYQLTQLQQQSLVYEALSYAWSSDDHPYNVEVDTYGDDGLATISTTQDLDSALRRLRYRTEE